MSEFKAYLIQDYIFLVSGGFLCAVKARPLTTVAPFCTSKCTGSIQSEGMEGCHTGVYSNHYLRESY